MVPLPLNCIPPTHCPPCPLQTALERAQAKEGADPAAVEQAARQAAERRLRERGWMLPDGSVRAPDQGAWLVTARKLA